MPRIQHVSIPMPPGREADARAFFGDILGLSEVPVPSSIAHLRLIWYQIGDTELHLFTEEPRPDNSGRHFCIAFDTRNELDAIQQKLTAAGYEPRDTFVIPGRPRFFCRDPFGNDIEFLTIESDYLEYQ